MKLIFRGTIYYKFCGDFIKKLTHFVGKILKDNDTLESYKVESGITMHLVVS